MKKGGPSNLKNGLDRRRSPSTDKEKGKKFVKKKTF